MTDDKLIKWIQNHYGYEVMGPGLSRINYALKDLLSELNSKKIITIAGTNGKGETSVRLSQHLKDNNHCTWISPHVERITERFISEKGEISINELSSLISFCHAKAMRFEVKLTFYEFLFFVFCHWAIKKEAEILVLEVGMGGRLDAVNALDADLVLLTSISRDHMEILGYRYDQILGEKLGVVKAGKTLISYLDLQYLREKTYEKLHDLSVKWLDLEGLVPLARGDFSGRNQILAYAAHYHLRHDDLNKLKSHLLGSKLLFNSDPLSNRGEVINKKNYWLLYGSHNPDGMRKLIQFLQSENYNLVHPELNWVLVSFSARSEKDVVVMLKMLKALGRSKIKICSFDHPKAFEKSHLRKLASQEGLDFVEDVNEFIQGRSGQHILVVGSYYFVGTIRSSLR